MKRKGMQTVVDYVNVQSDALWEFINDKFVHPDDRAKFLADLNDLCSFLEEAKNKGFSVDACIYSLDEKIAKLGGNA